MSLQINPQIEKNVDSEDQDTISIIGTDKTTKKREHKLRKKGEEWLIDQTSFIEEDLEKIKDAMGVLATNISTLNTLLAKNIKTKPIQKPWRMFAWIRRSF